MNVLCAAWKRVGSAALCFRGKDEVKEGVCGGGDLLGEGENGVRFLGGVCEGLV